MQPVCSVSERHADMLARNASEIVRWVEALYMHSISITWTVTTPSSSSPTSIFTLKRAREFLENIIENSQLFNYSEINQIAFMAQDIAQETLNQVWLASVKFYGMLRSNFLQLSDVNTTGLLQESSQILSDVRSLEEEADNLADTANSRPTN